VSALPALPRSRSWFRLRSANWNIPNALTVLRLLLIPAILVTFESKLPGHELIAPLLFIFASITDTLDGRIARRFGKVTVMGKFLDPLADKLLILSVLAVLVQDLVIPAWVAIVVVSRELMITGLRTIAAPQRLIIAATPWGKTKTLTQMLAVGLLMLQRPYPAVHDAAGLMLWIAVVFTVLSGIDYLWRYRRLLYR
jgi:CDP-diacylglycerol--glycerol-3-phosphate 3-phosphatidyltransferase